MRKKPDFDLFRNTLLKQGVNKKIPCWELFADLEIVSAILEKPLSSIDMNDHDKYIDFILEFQLKMGYDYLTAFISPKFPMDTNITRDDTAKLSKGKRAWTNEHSGVITNWEQFDNYPWPKPESVDYSRLEAAEKKVPDGMKIMVSTTGILENVQWLMGYESMAFAQFDDPELIDAMFEKVGNAMSNVFYNASDFSSVGLFAMGDDMGFNSGTLFSPDFLRQHVFPLQKKCVDFGHDKNIPFILHSCGNLETVIDDIIDFVGIDAKHSFEDKIMPIEIAKEKYIDRVTLVGGVDVDFLVRSSEDEVRQRVLNILQSCDTKGGYIMGSGNSIANYIPIKNYYAMMDETAKFML